jgi:hypothetical protein
LYYHGRKGWGTSYRGGSSFPQKKPLVHNYGEVEKQLSKSKAVTFMGYCHGDWKDYEPGGEYGSEIAREV